MAAKDVVSKDVLQHLAADIANILLHLDVEHDSVELLQTEQQRVEVRRADMVARMRRRDSDEKFILHIEIQNANDSTMPVRMLRYLTDILLQYPNEPVYQYLVYIGQRDFTMPDQLVLPDFTYRYHVLDMYTVDCSLLLAQDTPEALVLAILCDFKQRPTQEVVNYIVMRLRELTGDNERAFRNYYEMLETLADNRKLQANLDEAKNMLTQVDITRFSTYRWGLEAGIEQVRGELQPLLDAEKQRAEQAEAEKQKAEREKQKAEREKQKAETEKQKAETEKQKAEREKQKAETEKQKAETEKQKAEAEKQRLIQGVRQLIVMGSMSEQAIADLFQLSLAEVEAIASNDDPTQH